MKKVWLVAVTKKVVVVAETEDEACRIAEENVRDDDGPTESIASEVTSCPKNSFMRGTLPYGTLDDKPVEEYFEEPPQ